jgi:hypothetical protein
LRCPRARIQTILKTLVELFDDKALDKDGQIRVSMDLAAAFVKLKPSRANAGSAKGPSQACGKIK